MAVSPTPLPDVDVAKKLPSDVDPPAPANGAVHADDAPSTPPSQPTPVAAPDPASDTPAPAASTAVSTAATPPATVASSEQQTSALVDPLPVPSDTPTRATAKDPHPQPDADKPDPEDASTSHTLTPHRLNSAPARRKVNESSISDAAVTARSNGTGSPKLAASTARSSKPSFFSKLLRALVPCISPSPSHPIDLDVHPQKPAVPSPSPKEKVESKEDSKVEAKADATKPAEGTNGPVTTSPSQTAPPVTGDDPLDTGFTPVPLTVTPPTSPPSDAEVVLPPTPTSQLLPQAETEGVTSGAVQPPGSTGGSSIHEKPHSRHSVAPSNGSVDGEDSEGTSFTEDEDIDDVNGVDDLEDEEDKLILNGGAGIPIGPDGVPKPLLPPIAPQHVGRKCLVLDLDETLVHSSFKSIQQADYVVPVEIEFHWHNVYVIKRPGVDNFLKKMGEIYEIVVFTASLSKYADPVLDKLDIHQVVSHRLFRESCYNHKGNYVKDLSQLGRPIGDTIILDNSPASYIFHPNNAVPVSSWFNDPHDTELTDLVPFLADLSGVEDVRGVLDGAR